MRNLTASSVIRPAFGVEVWHRWLLIAVVLGYVGFLIIAPLAALVNGAFAEG